MLTISEIVEIAREIETEDPIDWGMLAIDEQTAYEMIATSVVENCKDSEVGLLLAIIVKLTVENFVLNIKLLKGTQ